MIVLSIFLAAAASAQPLPAPPAPPPPPLAIAPAPALQALSPDAEKAKIGELLKQAADSYFKSCDGYGAPNSSGDGMTKEAKVLGGLVKPSLDAGGNMHRVTPKFGPDEVAACGAALSDMISLPQFWLRKVSLLNARAMHRIAVGDNAGALGDLDSAQAAAQTPADPYYARSLKLDTDMIRAYALLAQGDQAKAEALALQAWSQRPYDRGMASAASLAMGASANPTTVDLVGKARAQLDPQNAGFLFVYMVQTGQFEQAAALYPGLVNPKPTISATATYNIASMDLYERIEADRFRLSVDGGYAYALAALGRNEEARAVIDAGRKREARVREPLPPPGVGQDSVRLQAQVENDKFLQDIKVFESWVLSTEARLSIGEGHGGVVLAELTSKGLAQSWVALDIAEQLNAKVPGAKFAVDAMRANLTRFRPPVPRTGIPVLFADLPEAETLERVSEKQRDILGLQRRGVEDGFTLTPNPADGFTTVKFRGIYPSASMTAELSLLRAAQLARAEGKKGFIVLARRDIFHTLNTTQYGRTIRRDATGEETSLDVMPVDPAALPPKYAKAPWRVVDADAVYAALMPIYAERMDK